DNRILAMNGIAIETLNALPEELIDEDILATHPEASRQQVKSLLAQPSCPAESSPPVTAIINVPERMLLIKEMLALCHISNWCPEGFYDW
ncbi:MAG: hypothetical protein WBR56_13385, partial [Sedimenticolaceae bacterium]